MPQYKMIAALCRGGGIGFQGTLPWPKLARDMRFFAEMTSSTDTPYNSAVIMGRKTWDSLPDTSKPLKYRDNIIISNRKFTSGDDDAIDVVAGATGGVVVAARNPCIHYIPHIHQIKETTTDYDVAWIIGGASIYEQVIYTNEIYMNEIYITFVDEYYEFDAAFPLMYQYESIDEILHLRSSPLNRRIWTWTDAEDVPNFVSFDTGAYYSVEDVDRDFISQLTRQSDITATKERRIPNLRFLKLKRLLVM
jgi:dihydrofolate reductase